MNEEQCLSKRNHINHPHDYMHSIAKA
jgi:hypothetical protein